MKANYDNIILKLFFSDNVLNNSIYRKFIHNINRNKYQNIRYYIENRFNDSESIRETLYRIKFKIYIRPVCNVCGNSVKFIGKNNRIFLNHCSNKCKAQNKIVQDKRYQTSLIKYGYNNTTNRDKYKNTCEKRYGVNNVFGSDIIKNKINEINKNKSIDDKNESIRKQKETCLIKYGTENYIESKDFKEKSKQTLYENYGVYSPMQSSIIKSKYNWNDIVNKMNITKRQNNTFNKSKTEEDFYMILIDKYGQDNVIRQYRSTEYPYNCDFYIKSLNLYIECTFHWTHGGHEFDKNNPSDIEKLNEWKNKAKSSKYYKNAIKTWTIRDVEKKNIAKNNDLNYVVIYDISDKSVIF